MFKSKPKQVVHNRIVIRPSGKGTTSNHRFPLLPLEVRHCIFNRLSFIDRLVCSQVCRSWRTATFNWPLMWSEINNGDVFEYGYYDVSKILLAYRDHIKHHAIHKLHLIIRWPHISADQKNAELLRAIEMLEAIGCARIHEVMISSDSWSSAWLDKLIAYTGQSITTLDLRHWKSHLHGIIIIDTVLSSFPNLRKFTYYSFKESKRNLPERETFEPIMLARLGKNEHQHLTDVYINMSGSARYLPLDPFIPRMPKLQTATFVSFDFINAELSTRAIYQFMPDLRSLQITTDGHMDTATPPIEPPKQPGLQQLLITEWSRPNAFGRETVYPRLVSKNHLTLETLIVDGRILTPTALNQFATLKFPCLRKVRFSDQEIARGAPLMSEPSSKVAALLRTFFSNSHCSSLTSVDFSVGHSVTDAILVALESLTCLTRLKVSNGSKLTGTGLLRFVELTHSWRRIEFLELASVDALTDMIFLSIGRCFPALKELKIIGTNCIGMKSGLEQFLDTCPVVARSLRSLDINCSKDEGKIEDDVIHALLDKMDSKVETFALSLTTPSMTFDRMCDSDWHQIKAVKVDKN
ncbi:hypothetical protein BJV82DRAFT_617908 [Fennellomyces sp. T-0311]|nr:hypothetical protein BJV82DRAFT_617908 [Fennellomyces sp. T-0311]